MTFTVRTRGAGGPIVAEYACPAHGRFEATVERVLMPDVQPCPSCAAPSPWTISAPLYKPQRGAVVRGRPADKPHPMAMDTRELGEGMPIAEWKAKRRKQWAEHDRATVRRDQAQRVERVLHAPEPGK